MKNQSNFHTMVQNLMLLDPESLLLIDSGVKLLLARQNLTRKAEKKEKEKNAAKVMKKEGKLNPNLTT